MTSKTKAFTVCFFLVVVVCAILYIYYNPVEKNVINNQYTYVNKTEVHPTTEQIYYTNNTNYVYERYIQFAPRQYRPCKAPIEYTVSGTSMFPLTNSEGKTYVDKVTLRELELGDVISFRNSAGEEIFHAITYLNKKDEVIYTAGYNNQFPDSEAVDVDLIHYRYCDMRR